VRGAIVLGLFLIACGPGSEVRSGRDLYLAYGCAACHGASGAGDGPSAALSHIKPRDLTNRAAFSGAATEEGIAATIAFGIAGGRTGMPAYPDIPRHERDAIARYILGLRPAPRVVRVEEAWAAESNPAWKIAAAYMNIVNATDSSVTVMAVSSPVARVVELHEMQTRDGMMSMQKIDRLPIAARGSATLHPGGTHLMLIDLVRDLRAGDTVPLTLELSDGTTQSVNVVVRSEPAAPATSESHASTPERGRAKEFTLVDHRGRPFHSSSLRGKPALLFFGYTHCPDACPTILSQLARAYRKAGPDARQIPTLFVSVDPRDTPPVLDQYLRYFAAVPAVGLTGSKEQIDGVTRRFGARYEIRDSGSAAGPLVDHTLRLYLLDRTGAVARTFEPNADPQDIARAMTDML
jgi:protein SCO1/2